MEFYLKYFFCFDESSFSDVYWNKSIFFIFIYVLNEIILCYTNLFLVQADRISLAVVLKLQLFNPHFIWILKEYLVLQVSFHHKAFPFLVFFVLCKPILCKKNQLFFCGEFVINVNERYIWVLTLGISS